ncbi:MAG: hypothetical protein LPK45_07490, partial [Bacteroidota bacterium]|nr:hypothetical protein [Bacteroidota bacterium]MDX5430917.1 hypothetical protein [Bacteroidota bacterium]MDX5469664.1 hypothetical protein [Bacteroidota bacterium]
MKIQYLRNDAIQTEKWDDCILHSSPSLIYAYSWYLDEVCDEWDALVLEDYRAVMPLPFTRKMGLHLALQPPFTQQLGVFSREALQEEVLREFIAAIPSKFRWVNYQWNVRNQLAELSKKTNYVLDLIQGYEMLYEAYDTSLKRALRKSIKSSCSLSEGVSFEELFSLIDYQNQKQAMGISNKSRQKLQRLLHACTKKGSLLVVGFYSPVNHLCSAGVFLKDHQRIYYLLGASDDMGREFHG